MKAWFLVVGCCLSLEAMAAVRPPDILQRVDFAQRLNAQAPLALEFRNEQGRRARLSDYFHDKPVILVLGYYSCKNLCSVVMDGLLASLNQISFNPGEQFEVVAVSINPGETPKMARMKKTVYLKDYRRPGAARALHFLTGAQPAIKKLADTVGFRYFYDSDIKQYVHAAGITVLTPTGRIARYFYGVTFRPGDLRLGLVEASMNRIGSVVDRLILLCCDYDPTTGKYSYIITNSLNAACALTALVLGGFIFVMVRRERHRTRGDVSRKESPMSRFHGAPKS